MNHRLQAILSRGLVSVHRWLHRNDPPAPAIDLGAPPIFRIGQFCPTCKREILGRGFRFHGVWFDRPSCCPEWLQIRDERLRPVPVPQNRFEEMQDAALGSLAVN